MKDRKEEREDDREGTGGNKGQEDKRQEGERKVEGKSRKGQRKGRGRRKEEGEEGREKEEGRRKGRKEERKAQPICFSIVVEHLRISIRSQRSPLYFCHCDKVLNIGRTTIPLPPHFFNTAVFFFFRCNCKKNKIKNKKNTTFCRNLHWKLITF